MANYMNLLATGGPYYIVGFVITFFTLMSSRYLLGMNIYPQERIVRVMFLSAVWLPALVICTILTYVKRSDKLISANEEAEDLRRQLAEMQEQSAKQNESDIAKKQVFEDEQTIAEAFVPGEQPAETPKKKKSFLSW